MNAKTTNQQKERPAPRLVPEKVLLDTLFPTVPADQRPTRRTLLHWREEGALPSVKLGRGLKAKVYYDLDRCIANIDELMRRRPKRRKAVAQ